MTTIEPHIVEPNDPKASSDEKPRNDRNERRNDTDQIIDDLVSIGRLWTHHGLVIGKIALQTSARSLELTAKALATLADNFEDEQEERAAESM